MLSFQIVYTQLAIILTAWSGVLRIVANSVPYQEVQCLSPSCTGSVGT